VCSVFSTAIVEKYACFNSVFEISCAENEILVFESVRYGRNDSHVASRCDVPFSWNCDIDVQFPLNRACAGKRRCSLDVNIDLFPDPCGYEEFLRVTYRCISGKNQIALSLCNRPVKVRLSNVRKDCVAQDNTSRIGQGVETWDNVWLIYLRRHG